MIDAISKHKSNLDTVSNFNINKDFFILNDLDNDVDGNDTKSISVNIVLPFKSTIVKNLNNSKALIDNTNDNNLNIVAKFLDIEV